MVWVPVSDWILLTGAWNDFGAWDDGNVWIDGLWGDDVDASGIWTPQDDASGDWVEV